MSRHGYQDDIDDPLVYGRWAGRVASAMRGKRGRKLLEELEAALLALPEKKLIAGAFAVPEDGCAVCALGAVAVSRKMQTGLSREDATKAVAAEWPVDDDECGDLAAAAFDIAEPMAREIMYWNDEIYSNNPAGRYQYVLRSVQSALRKVSP